MQQQMDVFQSVSNKCNYALAYHAWKLM